MVRGVECGALVVATYIKVTKIDVPTFGDAIAPALALSYAVGRLGCFLVGDDYGLPTDLPWGVRFAHGYTPSTVHVLHAMFGVRVPAEIAAGVVLPVHPTQLYERSR